MIIGVGALHQSRKVSSSRLLSWISSHSGWNRTCVLSVCIRTVGFVHVATVVRCCLVGAVWHKDGV
jgi:hypothetical protein